VTRGKDSQNIAAIGLRLQSWLKKREKVTFVSTLSVEKRPHF